MKLVADVASFMVMVATDGLLNNSVEQTMEFFKQNFPSLPKEIIQHIECLLHKLA